MIAGEEIAHSITHGTALLASLAAFPVLMFEVGLLPKATTLES